VEPLAGAVSLDVGLDYTGQDQQPSLVVNIGRPRFINSESIHFAPRAFNVLAVRL